MEVITVHTTQNIDIDYEIGGLGERLVARLIDLGIFIAVFIVVAIIGVTSGDNTALGIMFIIVLILFAFYDLVCEVFFNGQSLGKYVMKIRVISIDGARPRFGQYLLRWLFRMIDFTITWPGIVALISAAVSQKGQRVGDIVAGTAVIKTVARTKINNIVFTQTDEGYTPVFTQAAQLNDNDIQLIHEVLENYYHTGNNELIYATADKIRNYLAVTLPPNMNSMQFLQTIMKDHSHVSAHADAL